MKHLFFLPMAMVALLIGCQPSGQYDAEIAQLDSLIENTEAGLSDIEKYTVEKTAKGVEKLQPYIDYFKNAEGKDFPKELYTGPLSRLAELERGLSKWMYNRDQLYEKGQRNLAQMKSLRHDLEHNVLDSVKAKEYLEQEVRLYHQWSGTYEKRFPRAKASLQSLDSFILEIDSIKKYYEGLE